MVWKAYIRQHPQFGGYYQRVEQQPSWVVKLTVLTAAIVVVVPLLLLALAAIAVGAVVFVVGSLIASLLSVFNLQPDTGRGGSPVSRKARDGRENVRVVQRENPIR